MEQYRVLFDDWEWQDGIHGARFKAFRDETKYVGWIERSDTHHLNNNVGYRYAPPNLPDVEVLPMKYISTRGNAPAKTFTEIPLGGLAPDGGLYLPEQ